MARPRFQHLDPETRKQILETAAVKFSAKGFDGTSLNGLIEDLGISKGSFYYYFDDKADLFTTVAEHAWSVFLPDIDFDPLAFDNESYWPALEELMRQANERARANPWVAGFTRLIFNPPDIPEIRKTLTELFAAARDLQAMLIRRGQELGTVRDDLPVELLLALLVGADEAADRWFVDNWDRLGDAEIERLFTEVFAIFRRMVEPLSRR